jgi:hypothetical protein
MSFARDEREQKVAMDEAVLFLVQIEAKREVELLQRIDYLYFQSPYPRRAKIEPVK